MRVQTCVGDKSVKPTEMINDRIPALLFLLPQEHFPVPWDLSSTVITLTLVIRAVVTNRKRPSRSGLWTLDKVIRAAVLPQ